MTILGVVLAGGSASRFGADKAAAILDGRTLLRHVCARAAPQVDRLVINRNGDCGGYASLPDDRPGEGPLAGILAALAYACARDFAHVASFPCDAPFFPSDLVSGLRDRLAGADYCVARSGGQEHHTFALWDVGCAARLEAAFAAGTRSLRDVAKIMTKAVADFPPAGEGAVEDCFLNINTPADLALAARWLAR